MSEIIVKTPRDKVNLIRNGIGLWY